ncbi:MAG: hypothetical protein AAF806_21845 [Bacteroidota bacterium]
MQVRSRAELAQLYGYNCTKTFTRLLKTTSIPITPRKLVSINTQLLIFSELGIPTQLSEDEKEEVLKLLKE